MPAFLIGALTWFLAGAVARVLLGAGLSIASYVLIEDFVNDGLVYASGYLAGLGDIGQLMYLAGVGDAMSIIGSAMVVSVTLTSARIFLVRSS